MSCKSDCRLFFASHIVSPHFNSHIDISLYCSPHEHPRHGCPSFGVCDHFVTPVVFECCVASVTQRPMDLCKCKQRSVQNGHANLHCTYDATRDMRDTRRKLLAKQMFLTRLVTTKTQQNLPYRNRGAMREINGTNWEEKKESLAQYIMRQTRRLSPKKRAVSYEL